MKMKRSYREFLQDILDAITEIESFIDGISFDDFQSDRTKVLAVVKLLEIVGEAVKKIPDEQRRLYPEIPWRSISGMRNILIHEYWQIDIEVLWATIPDFPLLKVAVIDMLNQETD